MYPLGCMNHNITNLLLITSKVVVFDFLRMVLVEYSCVYGHEREEMIQTKIHRTQILP